MIKVAIMGASGFTGNELVRILEKHEEVELVHIQSRSNKGKKISEVYMDSKSELVYSDPSIAELNRADYVLMALPKEESAAIAPSITTRVIDLSPAHRFNENFVYGLPETNRKEIAKATRIANPGCYATACALAVLPLDKSKITNVAFDCKSGYSGGGKNKKYDYDENVVPYSLDAHYQKPEVGKFLKTDFSFAPHVVNAYRGLIATVHVFGDVGKLDKLFAKYYANEPFVKITQEIPTFGSVKNTPYCQIGGFAVGEKHCLIVSAIDNLLKGAASQAVQNLNIMAGFDETSGLL